MKKGNRLYSYHNPVFSFVRFMTWRLAFLDGAKITAVRYRYTKPFSFNMATTVLFPFHLSFPAFGCSLFYVKWEENDRATLTNEGTVYRFRATVQETYAFLSCILVISILLAFILYVSVISTCLGMPGELQIQCVWTQRHHKNIVQETHST